MADPTTGNDILAGDGSNNYIDALAGNDSVTGLAGDDTLRGNDGDDTIAGGAGNDQIEGWSGKDVLILQGSPWEYTAVYNPDTGFHTVTDLVAGRDGVDIVSQMEITRFNGGSGPTLVAVNPAGTWLAGLGDEVPETTYVELAKIGLQPGDTIYLTRGGDYKPGFDLADASTAMLGLFGNVATDTDIAPAVYFGAGTPRQSNGAFTDIPQDFTISGGLTRITIPAGATHLAFSVPDSFYNDNVDPDRDFAVLIQKADGTQNTNGADLLAGTTSADSLQGGKGADTVMGGPGADVLDGGAVTDRANYSDLNWLVYSGSPNGVDVNFGSGTATDGFGSTDSIANFNAVRGSSQADTLTGSTTNDLFEIFQGDAGNDVINGGAIEPLLQNNANRVVYSSATTGVEVQLGGAGDGSAKDGLGGTDVLRNINHVTGSNWADTLNGTNSGFTEQFQGDAGNDTINGFGGTDMVRYDSATAAVSANLVTGKAGDGMGGTDDLFNIEGLRGGRFNDTLLGGATQNGTGLTDGFEFYIGGGGNDSIDGGGGYDRVDYTSSTAGAVVQLGGAAAGSAQDGLGGIDTLVNIEAVRGSHLSDTLTGVDAAFQSFEGRSGADSIDGGAGFDRADYAADPAGVQIDLAAFSGIDGFGYMDTLVNIEQLRGSLFNDSLAGDGFGNNLVGNNGNDTLEGRDGDDSLDGGAGADSLLGGKGNDGLNNLSDGQNDTVDGDDGNDVARYQLVASTGVSFTATGASGVQADGAGGIDQLIEVEEVHVFGTGFSDTLSGDGQRNWLQGNQGDDVLTGGGGRDTFGYDLKLSDNGNRQGIDQITDLLPGDEIQLGHTAGSFSIKAMSSGKPIGTLVQGDVDFSAPVNTGSGFITTVSIGVDTIAGADLQIQLQGAYSIPDFVSFANGQNGVNLQYQGAMDSQGGAGDDFIEGYKGNDTLRGVGGNDTVYGAFGNDSLEGGTGNDNLIGEHGNDTMAGGDGEDYLLAGGHAGLGSDSIDGGLGYDTAAYDFYGSTGGITFQAADGNTQVDPVDGSTDQLSNIEQLNIFGGSGNDKLTGNSQNNYIAGQGGNDTLTGGAGADLFDVYQSWMPAGGGRDLVTDLALGEGLQFNGLPLFSVASGDGSGLGLGQVAVGAWDSVKNTTAIHVGTDTVSGADLVVDLAGKFGVADFKIQDLGFASVLVYSNAPSKATEGPDTLDGSPAPDVIDGLGGNDLVSGFDGTDSLLGSAGNDTLQGEGGNDTLQGGTGDDALYGGAGNDSIVGGDGYDRVEYGNSPARVVVDMAAGLATEDGYGGMDTLAGVERVVGSTLDDSITGSGFADDFSGGQGNDTLNGAGGFDFVAYGGATAAVVVDLKAGTATGGEGNDSLVSIEGVAGSRHADTLRGTEGDDYFRGDGWSNDSVGGADSIDGRGGFDVIDYRDDPAAVNVNLQTGKASDGRGNVDTFASIEEARGSQHHDTLTGTTNLQYERFEGAGGDDSIDGGAITDTINQANGNQVSYQRASAGVTVDLLAGKASGGAGNDTLKNINEVRGSTHGDTLYGSNNFADVTESFEGREGNDSIDGRDGFDLVRFDSATSGITASLVTGTSSGMLGSDSFTNVEGFWGGSGNDSFTGGNLANGAFLGDGLTEFFLGGAGSDTIDGGVGYDFATYQNSPVGVNAKLNDTLDGSASDGFGGIDVLRNLEGLRGSAHNDTLTGSDSASFENFEGREGNDLIDGMGGTDRADYQRAKAGVVVNLAAQTASDGYGGTDTLLNIEQVRGSRGFGDQLTGSAGNNLLEGLDGADTLNGGDGSDTLVGGAGNDQLVGGGGFADTASYAGASAGVQAELWAGKASKDGHGGVDTFSGIANLSGSAHGDILAGDANQNWLVGLDGNDSLYGAAGNDDLEGGRGSDLLVGGEGFDRVVFTGATTGINVELWANRVNNDGQGGSDTLSEIEAVGSTPYADLIALNAVDNQLDAGSGDDSLYGGDGNDTLTGNIGKDYIDGGNGVDTVAYFGAAQGVVVELWGNRASNDGDGGNDTLVGIENVIGSAKNDLLAGDTGGNQLTGGIGFDSLYGGAGNDTLTGGHGADFIDGGAGFDQVSYLGASTGVVVELWGNRATNDGEGLNDTLLGVEHVIGSNFADLLAGTTANDSLEGGHGNDSLYGGAGNDTLVGGQGANLLNGQGGSDTFVLGTGFGGIDTVADFSAGAGGDLLDIGSATGLKGDYFASGHARLLQVGNHTQVQVDFDGSGSAVGFVTVAQLNNVSASTVTMANIVGGYAPVVASSNKLVNGDAGANNLAGESGNDTVNGLAGNDTLAGLAGNDVLDGGADVDTATYAAAPAGVQVELWNARATKDGYGGADTLLNIENVIGSGFGDALAGSVGANLLEGGSGADSLYGGDGNDTVAGGLGADFIDAGTGIDTASYAGATAGAVVELWGNRATNDGQGGNDSLVGVENVIGSAFGDLLAGSTGANLLEGMAGADSLYGGDGNDTVAGGQGSDFMDAGTGIDTASFAGAGAGVVVELWGNRANDGQGGNDSVVGVENVIGSGFADLLAGDTAGNVLEGGAGADSLYGGGGNDSLSGGQGNDFIDAGVGTDMVSYAGATAGVTVELWGNRASNDGQGGNDTLLGVEHVIGSGFADLIAGTTGNDSLEGGAGGDTLYGGAGNDSVAGGTGNDTVYGQGGSDVFQFGTASGADVLADFKVAEGDRIQLASNVNGSGIVDGNSALAATSDVGGNAVVNLGGGHTITLVGVLKAGLSAGDFSF